MVARSVVAAAGQTSADGSASAADEAAREAAAGGVAVLVHRLGKVFPARGRAPPKVAVADLSLRIHNGECFGFLGVNGTNSGAK